MIDFDKDKNLGQVVKSRFLYSFGVQPLDSLKDLVFSAGGNKFSSLCGFSFISKVNKEFSQFFIAFVCKLRSKIYHQAHTNPSKWFIFKKVSSREIHCLDQDMLLQEYQFDINKFFDTVYFQKSLSKFKSAINTGLKKHVPEYVKQHGAEKAADILTSYDDGGDGTLVKDAVGRYVKAISESLAYIDDTLFNDKFYKLISYDVKVEAEDSRKQAEDPAEEELDEKIEEALKNIYK